MRILYLTEEPITFSGTMVRGGQIHVRNVVEGLRERGHEVHLIDWNNEAERACQHSITPGSRFVIDPLRTLRRAISVGREAEIDVIVSKTRKTYLPGLVAARTLGVPHVVHVGSSPGGSGEEVLERIDGKSLVTRLKASHDAYFVVCNAIRDDLNQLGVERSRIFDVKNAVDTERFHPDRVPVDLEDQFRTQIGGNVGNGFRLGFVGGLHPYKGLDDLADAIHAIDDECRLVVAGGGPERERLEQRFGNRAVFLGPVPYEQIPAVFDEIDVLVLPSHTEGLPRVVLEAQATGTPVIATDVGGLPEVIGDGETGLLVDSRSPDQLAAAIGKLADDPELRSRLGENGRNAVVESYSWETMYERYERFLQAVVTTGSNE